MSSTRDRILTRHPAGKQGVRIERAKYDAMRRALIAVIPRRRDGVAFGDLAELVKPKLARSAFPPEASIRWYVVTVKQDLEARGEIEQVPGARPQRVRRTPTLRSGGPR